MKKRTTNLLSLMLLIVVAVVFSIEVTDLSGWGYGMTCPDSPFLTCDEDNDYILKEGKPYLSNAKVCLALLGISAFHDQGFVKSIFHPPKSIL